MKILYTVNVGYKLIETFEPVFVMDIGLVFKDGKKFCVSKLTKSLDEIGSILSKDVIDLRDYVTEVYKPVGDKLEEQNYIMLVNLMESLLSKYRKKLRKTNNDIVITCASGDVKRLKKLGDAMFIACTIDSVLECKDFSEAMDNSVWSRFNCYE